MLKNLFYFNKELKKIINIASPIISKFEIDISLNKLNILFDSFNLKKLTLIMNSFIVFLNGAIWRNSILVDMLCIDYLKNMSKYELLLNSRFRLKYTFRSLDNQSTINFYLPLRDKFNFYSLEKMIPSVIWLQREVWDMFGITFKGATDLRRILTDYGFKSFPLRADFPVFGNLEIYYDIEMSEILYKKVESVQENRFFGYHKSLFWF